MAQVAAHPRLRSCPTTWCFDLTLQMLAFSSAQDIRLAFLAIFNDAHENRAINGLQDVCPSYNMPEEGGLAHICGYLHALCKFNDTAVHGWLSDSRIIAENSRWTPVQPGKNSDWRQHTSIRDTLLHAKKVA